MPDGGRVVGHLDRAGAAGSGNSKVRRASHGLHGFLLDDGALKFPNNPVVHWLRPESMREKSCLVGRGHRAHDQLGDRVLKEAGVVPSTDSELSRRFPDTSKTIGAPERALWAAILADAVDICIGHAHASAE